MVMDAQPSPQSVGREFVRQYYTLLNKAPNILYRFYNNNSSFIHGGLDSHNRETTVVIGQKNIYNKIQQLNFRDCHAKISQVDAQATLGNGVVVQVSGELSNDGQPMRRFTQTFVLAAQSPKNYYVHNDIFRYQDLYTDDENEAENRSENGDEQDAENKIIDTSQQTAMNQPQIYYSCPAAAVATHVNVGNNVPISGFAAQPAQVNGVVHEDLLQAMQQAPQTPIVPQAVVPTPSQLPHQSPSIAPIQSSTMSTPVTSNITQPNALPVESAINKDLGINISTSGHGSSDAAIVHEPSIKVEIDHTNKKDEYQKQSVDIVEKHENTSQIEPKTYANLFKSSSSGNSTNLSSGFVSLPPTSHNVSVQSPVKPHDMRSDNTINTALPQRSNTTRQNKDFAERRTSNTNSQYSDSHQLFFGNVPHHATEEELKSLFSKFGIVVDLKLLTKVVSKMPGVRVAPNYGFITYEDTESVQNCLANCPLHFPDNSPDGQKLNVEEKKNRLRNSNDIPRMANNLSGNSGMGNSQRPSGGPNRSITNTSGMLRSGGASGSSGTVRGNTGGPRSTGNFARNDRGPGGPPNRGNINGTSGNTYGRR